CRSARTPPHRAHQQRYHRERHRPPRRHAAVCQQRGDADRRRDTDGDEPIVTEDEPIPETGERQHAAHASAPLLAGERPAGSKPWRSTLTAASEVRSRSARMPISAASPPGQETPAPSPLQKVPKLARSRPPVNFSVSSGTRLSGARTSTPAASTITRAAAAAAAAIATPWLRAAPNVITMNATSTPSRNTPLKETVNAYQSTGWLGTRTASA